MRSHPGPALSLPEVFGIQVLQTRCWPLTPASVSKGAVPALEVPSRKEQRKRRTAAGLPLSETPQQRQESHPASRFSLASLELTLPLTWLRHKGIKAYVR